ncbi:hypothetical protein ACFWN7_15275 [Agromyces sp. NPDC058484]|uniref:hypothetical protein n=1 Tax=Agromyces sp. NPDC058484 TaxID=3346524 RepID=UPI003654251C
MSASTEPDDTRPRRAMWGWIAVGAVVIAAVIIAFALWPRAGTVAEPGASGEPAPATASAPSYSEPTPTPPASGEPTPPPQAPPVGFDDEAEVVPGVTFSIADLEAVEGEAEGRGEVAGPAIRFRVDVANATTAPVELGTTVVNVFSGSSQEPAQDLSGPGVEPFPAEVVAGGAASGVFVFSVPLEQRDEVTISIDFTVGVPIVVFQGTAPS